jgi:hypothetical protein
MAQRTVLTIGPDGSRTARSIAADLVSDAITQDRFISVVDEQPDRYVPVPSMATMLEACAALRFHVTDYRFIGIKFSGMPVLAALSLKGSLWRTAACERDGEVVDGPSLGAAMQQNIRARLPAAILLDEQVTVQASLVELAKAADQHGGLEEAILAIVMGAGGTGRTPPLRGAPVRVVEQLWYRREGER